MKAQRAVKVYLYSFFNLSAKWRWVVNPMPWPLHPLERDMVSIVQEAELCIVSTASTIVTQKRDRHVSHFQS